jgi:hypothetical protein
MTDIREKETFPIPETEQSRSVHELQKIRTDLIALAYQIPPEMREALIFDEWTVKDILAHISGWDSYTIGALAAFFEGETPDWGGEVDEFNRQSVEERKNLSWEEVLAEFEETGHRVIKSYSQVPESVWNQPMWPDQDTTPHKSIQDDIYHYGVEHLPQLQQLAGLS